MRISQKWVAFRPSWYPVLLLVVSRAEFWVYTVLHLLLSSLVATDALVVNEDFVPPWPAVTCLMLLCTFLVTHHYMTCHRRHAELNAAFSGIDLSARLFVRELAAVSHDLAIQGYMIRAAKYFLAALYCFYLALASGDLVESEWCIIQARGLLEAEEVLFLKKYPGNVVALLSNWALRAVTEMLKQPSATKKLEPSARAGVYNRLDREMQRFASNSVAIIYILESPHSYVHLMNVALSFSLGISGYTLALSLSFLSFLPYIATLVAYMGIREVSFVLADPLRSEEPENQIATLLNYAFNDTVAILEASSMYDPVSKVPEAKGFSGPEIESRCTAFSEAERPRCQVRPWRHSRKLCGGQQLSAWLNKCRSSKQSTVNDSTMSKAADDHDPPRSEQVLMSFSLPQPPEGSQSGQGGSKGDHCAYQSVDVAKISDPNVSSRTAEGLPWIQVVDVLNRFLVQFQAVAQRLDDWAGRTDSSSIVGSSVLPHQKVLWPPAAHDVLGSSSLAQTVLEQQKEAGIGAERIRALKGTQPCCKVPQCFSGMRDGVHVNSTPKCFP